MVVGSITPTRPVIKRGGRKKRRLPRNIRFALITVPWVLAFLGSWIAYWVEMLGNVGHEVCVQMQCGLERWKDKR